MDDGEVKFSWLRPHETLLIPFNFTDPAAFIHLNKQSAGYVQVLSAAYRFNTIHSILSTDNMVSRGGESNDLVGDM